MMDPVETRMVPPPAIAPPRGLSGIFDDYDPHTTLDLSRYGPNEVLLNVYDLGDNETFRKINQVSTGNNNLLIGGLFHASVEVYGVEWCFGYTEEERTGVSHVPPRMHPQHTYRTTVPMGQTRLSEREVRALLVRMSQEWMGNTYNLIHRNCLNFSNALCHELGVGRIPGWVDRASRTASLIDTTSKAATEKAIETARLARELSTEVEQTVRAVLPQDVDEAQRTALEALEAVRRESLKAIEVAQVESAKLAEVAQAQAQAIQSQALVLGEVAQVHAQVITEEVVIRSQELGQKAQEQARALGSSLWQWGQDLQKAAARALGEDGPASRRAANSSGWDTALGGLGLLGGSSGSSAEPARRRPEDAWGATAPRMERSAAPDQVSARTSVSAGNRTSVLAGMPTPTPPKLEVKSLLDDPVPIIAAPTSPLPVVSAAVVAAAGDGAGSSNASSVQPACHIPLLEDFGGPGDDQE